VVPLCIFCVWFYLRDLSLFSGKVRTNAHKTVVAEITFAFDEPAAHFGLASPTDPGPLLPFNDHTMKDDEWIAFDPGLPSHNSTSPPPKSYGSSVRKVSTHQWGAKVASSESVRSASPQLVRRKERTRSMAGSRSVASFSQKALSEEEALKRQMYSRTESNTSYGTATTAECSDQEAFKSQEQLLVATQSIGHRRVSSNLIVDTSTEDDQEPPPLPIASRQQNRRKAPPPPAAPPAESKKKKKRTIGATVVSTGLPKSNAAGHPPISKVVPQSRGRAKSKVPKASAVVNTNEPLTKRASQQSTIPTSNTRSRSRSRTSSGALDVSTEGDSRGRSRQRPPPVQTNIRGRSRGRSADVKNVGGQRKRSVSTKRRSTSTDTRSLPSDRRRRSQSRTKHPPPVSSTHIKRRRSRSQSLQRITSPTAASPAVTSYSQHVRSRSKPPLTMTGRDRRYSADSLGSNYRHDSNIGIDITFDREQPRIPRAEPLPQQKQGLMSRLFGDQGKKKKSRPALGILNEEIRPRILLAATVYHNTATNLWITTINTNQRGVAKNPSLANKYLKAFSFQSESEARESAIANAPPKMMPFKQATTCHTCSGGFAVFRRACHCRNCGVCICKDCALQWPSKMIPATYNLKNESVVKVCKQCDSLSSAFKQALLAGNYEESIALYGTGNINLRTQFRVANKRDEVMFPVHCAVLGGNLGLVRWLIQDHFCPIKVVRSAPGRKSKRSDSLIMTSKGRNVLSLALERLKVDVMQFLVVECGVSIYEHTDLKTSLRALEAALVSLPRLSASERQNAEQSFDFTRWDKASFDELSEPSSLGSGTDHIETGTVGNKSARTKGSRGDCVSTHV